MAANMYDQAAQAQFINTYVPIDFGTLYQIGSAQKAAVDQAAQQFSAQLQKFGEFQSPSDVDTQKYYDLTIGRQDIQNAINQLASNPDALKDAAFRSNLQSLINSVDYAALSKLKTSADNLRARQASIAKLVQEGAYNEEWDDVNISQWDTTNSGIMTSLSPLRYTSLRDLLAPYVDNIQPQFFKGESPVKGLRIPYYNWQGINADMRYKVLNDRLGDILSTPQGEAWYDTIAKRTLQFNPNATIDDVNNAFMHAMMTVTSYKDTEMPILDQARLQQDLASMKSRSSGSSNESPFRNLSRISVIQANAAQQVLERSRVYARQLAQQGLISTNDPTRMTDEDQVILLSSIAKDIKDNGLKNEYMFPITSKEYNSYFQTNPTSFTNKAKESLGDNSLEPYSYRNGDMILTDDGFVVDDIPNASLDSGFNWNSNESINASIAINNLLRSLNQDNSAFRVHQGDNAFMYNEGDDVTNNVVKVSGDLFVTRDALEDAIEKVAPDQARALTILLEDGFEYQTSSGNTRKAHAAMEESDYRINGEKTYVFKNVARSIGNVPSLNQAHNLQVSHDLLGASATANSVLDLTNSSFVEANSSFNR